MICQEEEEEGEDPKLRRMQRMLVRVVGCLLFFWVGVKTKE